jgi:tRNA A-37 threonylcarbamoyl transferase component Bud32
VIAAGQSIGNYRILNKIGTGGMGAVFLAEHPLIGKRVALKVIHRELAGNREVVSRFFQEARAVNKIGNEHIVEIHDFGVTADGDHFFIMEYLEGRTLAAILLREKVLDVMRALHIGAQIAHALAAAHAAGIVHRDLKPDNIMLMTRLGDHDFVKVLDFGLAKVFSASTAVKTAKGVLLGTPQYMSPEACESKGEVDHRTDIYALGVLMFQMMTGALPFDGESMGEVLVKQVTALPPVPRALNPAIPPSVEQILLRCLAKRVDARFATMMQLREALLAPEAYLRGSPPIAPARSVGGGEVAGEARTLMLHTGVHPSMQRTQIAGPPTRALPLPAPAMSMIGTGQGPTIVAGAGGVANAHGWRAPAMPGMPPPQEPTMNTMQIATPMGYSSRPPRRVWPAVLVGSLIVGLLGGVVSVARCGRTGEVAVGGGGSEATAREASKPAVAVSGAGAAAGTGSAARAANKAGSAAGGAPTTGGASSAGSAGGAATASSTSGGAPTAGSAATPATAAKPAKVQLSIDSMPPGATVVGPSGEALGKTPLKIEWPVSDAAVTFELRLTGFHKKLRQTVVNSNTALHVELERIPLIHHPLGPQRSNDGDNGLMRPD